MIRHGRQRAGFWASLSARERRTLWAMLLAVVGLHVVGFIALLASVAPSHDRVGTAGIMTVGIGVTAYTLGLRHAFDADHISAIDNATRKLMAEGKRPLSVGFWFSLGHSTVVFGLTLLISIGVRSLDEPVTHGHSTLREATSWVGTAVSGGFLYLIAAINIVILLGIVKVFREMKAGDYDETGLERHLDSRGLMNRLFGRLAKAVTKALHMYPVGLLFGLGLLELVRERRHEHARPDDRRHVCRHVVDRHRRLARWPRRTPLECLRRRARRSWLMRSSSSNAYRLIAARD